MSQSQGNSWKLENESSHSPFSRSEELEAIEGHRSMGLVRKSDTSTRVSLLVEALIRSMIAAYETDSKKVSRTYRKICKRLFRMGLIDGSWSMAELEGARAQFEHCLIQLLDKGPGSQSPAYPSLWPGGDSASQYKRDFEEIKQIGGGAFGKVFQVKHKLDGTEYAVKKIPIYSEGLDSIKNYLSEVQTFASMNHPNIVQYKAAWLEIGTSQEVPSLPKTPWNKSNLTIPRKESNPFVFHESISFTNMADSDTNFEIVFEDSNNSGTESSKNCSKHDIKSSEVANAVVVQEPFTSKPRLCWVTLYIQMSLCHSTLHQWLRRRTKSLNTENSLTSNVAQVYKTKAIKEILIQILKGLAYIHSRGVVHHDIKPSNIFITAEGGSFLVQLGDFGLACPLQRGRHSLARGTPLYAAPEQLAGRCNPKSDMYSVGLVLFELLEDFRTDMERTKRISDLRSHTTQPVPQDPEINNIVNALVRHNPEERPDAATLLRDMEEPTDARTIEALQELLKEKDREIHRLTSLLRKHGIEEV